MESSSDYLRFASPYRAIPVRIPYLFPLAVCVVVEEYAEDPESDNRHGDGKPQVVRVGGEVEGVACIDRGNPHHAAPALGEKEEKKK